MATRLRWAAAALVALWACGGGGGGAGAVDEGPERVFGDLVFPDGAIDAATDEARDDGTAPDPAWGEEVADVVADEAAADPVGDEAADDAATPDEASAPDEVAEPDEAVVPDEAASPDHEVVPDEAAVPDEAVALDVAPEEVTVADPGADEAVVDTAKDIAADGDGGFPPSPAGSCRWLYDTCLAGCAAGDTVCQAACLAGLSAAGKQQQGALDGCLDAEGCYGLSDADFQACLEDRCLDEFFACFSGELLATCVDLTSCILGCASGDQACVDACFNNATYLANWDWQRKNDCLAAACPSCVVDNPTPAQDAECDACFNPAVFGTCGERYQACTPAGTRTCGQLIDCLNACASGDTACVNGCFETSTFTAQGLHDALFRCIDGECPATLPEADWLACANAVIDAACKTAWDACGSDSATCATHCAATDGCGADGCGGTCGTCTGADACDGATGTCLGPEYPDRCRGPNRPSAATCPGWTTFEGCCDGAGSVVFCNNDGHLYCVPCAKNALPVDQTCGWRAAGPYYDCGMTGADPSGNNPLACP